MYRMYKKILQLDEADFKFFVKSGIFRKKFYCSFQGAPRR